MHKSCTKCKHARHKGSIRSCETVSSCTRYMHDRHIRQAGIQTGKEAGITYNYHIYASSSLSYISMLDHHRTSWSYPTANPMSSRTVQRTPPNNRIHRRWKKSWHRPRSRKQYNAMAWTLHTDAVQMHAAHFFFWGHQQWNIHSKGSDSFFFENFTCPPDGEFILLSLICVTQTTRFQFNCPRRSIFAHGFVGTRSRRGSNGILF